MKRIILYGSLRERVLLTGLILGLSILVLLGLLLPLVFRGDVLHVAAPLQEQALSRLSPYGPGFTRELVERFCAKHGLTPKWHVFTTWQAGWDLLLGGHVDLLAGRGLAPPEQFEDEGLVAGPPLASAGAVIVRHAGTPARQVHLDLCRHPIPFATQPGQEILGLTSSAMDCPISFRAATAIDPTSILREVSHGINSAAVFDEREFALWQPLYLDVRPYRRLSGEVAERWFWKKSKKELAKAFARFFEDETTRLAVQDLNSRYFGFFPRRTDYYELRMMKNIIRRRLPKYTEAILKAARRYEIDPLFLAAVIYQESRFNPRARSGTGVRGIMQLSLPTAAEMGVESRLDPLESIQGGTRYLRRLHNQFSDLELPPWQRWFFVLAAYNQGFGHARDAMLLAERRESDPTRWRDVREAYLLLNKRKYYKNTRHGYARGYEAAEYVDKVRYYYYVLNALAVLSGPEAEHLAPLATALPAAWP